MTGKNLFQKILYIFAVTCCLLLCACSTGYKQVASIDKFCTSPITQTSSVSFAGQSGDLLKYHVKTDTKQGTAEFAIFDADDQMVVDWCSADELDYPFTLENSQNYKFRVRYTDFVGHFKAKLKLRLQ